MSMMCSKTLRKNQHLLLLLLVLPQICLGKDNPSQYNAHVNKAELALTDRRFKEGLRFYDSAFVYKEIPFAQDLYNASICALKTGDMSKAFLLCRHLASKGVGKAFFEKKSVFIPLRNERAQWSGLLDAAKRAKDDYDRKEREIAKITKAISTRAQRQLQDDLIAGMLIKIFRDHEYLSEDIIGANVSADTILSFEPKFNVTIVSSYRGWIKTDTLFSSLLKEMLVAGTIKPEYYARIRDESSYYTSSPYYGSKEVTLYKCSLYREKGHEGVQERTERLRREIGLCTMTEFMKKIAFNIDRAHADFLIDAGSISIHSFSDEAAETMFRKNNDVIILHINGCER